MEKRLNSTQPKFVMSQVSFMLFNDIAIENDVIPLIAFSWEAANRLCAKIS